MVKAFDRFRFFTSQFCANIPIPCFLTFAILVSLHPVTSRIAFPQLNWLGSLTESLKFQHLTWGKDQEEKQQQEDEKEARKRVGLGLSHLLTKLVVLTVDPAWRSFLTTLEWPLEDAIISAVFPNCEEVEGCLITHGDESYTENNSCHSIIIF